MNAGALLIMSDFNIHVDNANDANAIKFLDLLDSMGLTNHVNIPTHRLNHTLDLIISRKSCDLEIHDVISSYFISDHCFIQASTSVQKPDKQFKTRTYIRLKHINIAAFKEDLKQSQLCVNPSDDLDKLVHQYHSNISEILDNHAPEITRTVKTYSNSQWFTKDLNTMKLHRRKCEYKWRKTGLESDHESFNQK